MIKKIVSVILTALFVLSFASCGAEEIPEPSEYYSATFFGMDTEITVKLARDTGNVDEDEKKIYFEDSYLSDIVKKCADVTATHEAILSRTKADSALSAVNAECDVIFDVDDEVLELLGTSDAISVITDGAFDATVGTVTELWNVTGDSPAVPADDAVTEALSHVGYTKLSVKEGGVKKSDKKTKVDFGAIGKGYTLGKIIEYLKTTDVQYGLVSFGGNIGTFGEKPNTKTFKVGITNASETSKVVGYVFTDGEFVSVSGDYERFFESDGVKYSHIFDPATGRPAETDISSVSVISENAAIADALSTALFVMGSEKALEFYAKVAEYDTDLYDFEALIQTKDGEIILTDGLKVDGAFEVYVEPIESETE